MHLPKGRLCNGAFNMRSLDTHWAESVVSNIRCSLLVENDYSTYLQEKSRNRIEVLRSALH